MLAAAATIPFPAPLSYESVPIDYFSLGKVDGAWKIVNKTFTHTGGELPQG